MDGELHAADHEGNVDLDVTGEHPGFTSAAPDVTKGCAGNPSIDSIGDLPWHLRQGETCVQDRVQAGASIDDRGDVNHFSVWPDDTVLVQENLPMLVTLVPNRNLSDGELRHVRNVFETGNELGDGEVTGKEIGGVIRPAKQSGEVIRGGSVGKEDPVQDRISRSGFNGRLDVGTTAGAQADETVSVCLTGGRDFSRKGVISRMEGVGCRILERTEALVCDVVAEEIEVGKQDGTFGSSDGVLDFSVQSGGVRARNVAADPQV